MRFWKIHFGSFMRKSFALAIAFVVFMIWKSFPNVGLMNTHVSYGELVRGTIAFPVQNCRSVNTNQDSSVNSERNIFFNTSAMVKERVLVLSKRSSVMRAQLFPVLEGNRFAYDVHYLTGREKDPLPTFTERKMGKYVAIVFTSFSDYFGLSYWNKQLLDNYCRAFKVGMILFNQGESTSTPYTEGFPFKVRTNVRQYKSYHVAKNATILRLVKGDNILDSEEKHDPHKWSVFVPRNGEKLNRNFEVVARSSFIEHRPRNKTKLEGDPHGLPVVLHDCGKVDKIHKVYFGAGLMFWPHKLLFLDALAFVSLHRLVKSLDRWIQVDIDDIFVGKSGIRMKKEDVKALIVTQRSLQKLVPGFQFNLGFSGKYFLHGNEDEDDGDRALVENAGEFRWFDHTWAHKQPHLVDNLQAMEKQMILNMEFAKKYNIPVDGSYSVAPHHSGVYPVHDILYDAWGKTSGVQVTSTEEYPHLKPPWKRRGFVYRNVMVLPRQTCGLFTHNLFLNEYPGGKEVLLKSIYGGELFQVLVNNPISIFMTHLSNYGNDRLALYTFTNVIKFVQCWTNLRLMSLPPVKLGKKYFELFPGEVDPIWHNPCKDPRHKDIWPSWKSCNRLPSFLVVGPQKTGTTALHMFLSVHPEVRQNNQNVKSYEETQFFGSGNYFNGVDWYMNHFPDLSVLNRSMLLFEKTANYFDSNKAPMRVHSLLPDAKIIVILNDPVRRAYSWYQHMRSHNDDVAWNIKFYDLVTSDGNATAPIKSLRNRCLTPGLYAEHLERWLLYFPATQILTIDGEQLKTDPVQVMAEVQSFIRVKKRIDYGNLLKYNERKGFFCLAGRLYNGHSCLGRSKGRQYPPMRGKSEEFLKDFYREPNRRLAELLHKIRQPLPPWLHSDVVQ